LHALPEQYELFWLKLMESSVSDLGSCLITLENLFNPVDGGNQDVALARAMALMVFLVLSQVAAVGLM
jgi:hypothetical protein